MRAAEHNQALREATRQSIEASAVRVFARHGFAASSIRHIAEDAGLSVGSIYRHYASKEALFDELLAQASTGLAAAAEELAGVGDPLELVRGFTREVLTDFARGGTAAEFYLVVNQGFLTDTPAGTAARLALAQRSLWEAFADLVRRGQATGRFVAGDPAQLTACYFAMLSGLANMRLVVHDTLNDAGVDIVLRLLTTEGRP
ncbi:TetR/AcrR family transcriptional regulator [Zhihengliuella halotolerans]|uniref:TetR family transcriptional regulator n=1 Tax=Zhihengliuella halotolerans TaxID=370736 RepID=A0A4V2G9M3_9MICC|nr:TetR/AcrR family transcriptional regulator [Zhihengliuella halotolerans]RZU60966.1 TetR family transcriptional regulator [Zhihengliuella halotolerans]